MNRAALHCFTSWLLLQAFCAYGQEATNGLPETNALVAQARAHEHGEGLRKDVTRAIELYCEAARAGDADAQFGLGWIYANGRGVRRNDALAASFFLLAAAQGHQQAAGMLRFVGPAGTDVPECLREKPVELPTQEAAVEPPQPAVMEEPLPPFVPATAAQKRAVELVNTLAPEFGIHPRLALAVIRTESNFNPRARSPKNAQGLMQLIPETAARFNVSRPYDPEQNIRGGLAYLRWLLAYFAGNVKLVAAAYNAGERVVERYRGIPPYRETQAYVKRIVQFFGREQHPFDRRITKESPQLSRIRTATAF